MFARSGVVTSTPRPANWSAKSAEISPLAANRNGRGVKHLALGSVGWTEPPPEDLPGRVHQHSGLEAVGLEAGGLLLLGGADAPRNRLSRRDRAYRHTGRGRPSKAFQSPEGWNRAPCTRAFSQDRLAQRLTKFHSVPRPGNQSRRWAQAYLQIDASLFSPSVSPKISMVSASPSVNPGVGPRLRRLCKRLFEVTHPILRLVGNPRFG